MTASIAATFIAQPAPSATATQNLFEHVARHAQSLPEGAGPSQVGEQILGNLKGFFERAGSFAERAGAVTRKSPDMRSVELVSLGQDGAAVSGRLPDPPPAAPVDKTEMDKVIQSLGAIFDHSIETQLVVRGTTQISGAANTLLRGQ